MSTGTIHHTSGCGTGFWRKRRRGSQGTFPSAEENQFKAVRHNQVTNLWYGQQRGVTGRTTTRSPWGGGSLNRPWRRGRSTGWVRTPPVPGGSTEELSQSSKSGAGHQGQHEGHGGQDQLHSLQYEAQVHIYHRFIRELCQSHL